MCFSARVQIELCRLQFISDYASHVQRFKALQKMLTSLMSPIQTSTAAASPKLNVKKTTKQPQGTSSTGTKQQQEIRMYRLKRKKIYTRTKKPTEVSVHQ